MRWGFLCLPFIYLAKLDIMIADEWRDYMTGLMLIIAIALIIWGSTVFGDVKKDSVEESNSIRERLNFEGQLLEESYVKYCGGHPDLGDAKIYKINIYNDGIVLYNNKHTGSNNYGDGVVLKKEDVMKISIVNQTQIINNPKITSILLFGVAGLAIGNKDKNEICYLTIDYKYNNQEFSLVLNSDIEKELGNLYGVVIKRESGLNRMTRISSSVNRMLIGENNNSGSINIFSN